MLSILATLDEFRSIFLSADMHIFNDHKNIAFDSLKTQHVLRWRNKIEEHSPIIHYIEGPKHLLSDNISRLQRLIRPDPIAEGKIWSTLVQVWKKMKSTTSMSTLFTQVFKMKTSSVSSKLF